MIKLSSHLMKSKLMIVINCVGVLLMITGFILAVFYIIQSTIEKDIIPDSLSIYLIMLLAGLCICVVPIEISNYFADIRKMSKEERLTEKLKNSLIRPKGTAFIKVFSIAGVLFCLISMFWEFKGFKELDTTLLDELNSMSSFEDTNIELPTLLSHFYKLTGIRIRNMINFYKFVAIMLIFIVVFFFDISDINKDKHRLTVSMWERIGELEKEVRALKAQTDRDD